MSLSNAQSKYLGLVGSVGKSALSALFPLEFEVYSIGLELTDSEDKSVMYMTFPIMSNGITENYPSRVNAQTTFGGVSVVSNSHFSPRVITLQGNFGRSFKIDPSSISTELAGGIERTNVWKRSYKGSGTSIFIPGVHTGYGFIKRLQIMLEESTTLNPENNKPYRLYFYNLSLNEAYRVVVPPQGTTLMQSMESNIMWNYNFSLLAVEPAVKRKTKALLNAISIMLTKKVLSSVL